MVVKYLLENGADVTIEDQEGEDVLCRVVWWQNYSCLIELLKQRDFEADRLKFYQKRCRRGNAWPAGDAIIDQYL